MKRPSQPDTLASETASHDAQPAASIAGPTGFARLALRISTWTGRLLVSAMLIVASLGFGRQVVLWWRADGADNALPAAAPLPARLGDPAEPHVLRFGRQQWAVVRREVAGDASAAAAALVEECRRVVAEIPATSASEPVRKEAEFVERIVAGRPLAGREGVEAVYACAERWPMVVGIKWPSDGPAPVNAATGADGDCRDAPPGGGPPAEPASGRSEAALAGAAPRVVTWGMAVPASGEAWTLYVFQPEQNPGSSLSATTEIALPPGTRHVLSMCTAGGGATSFRGDAHPAQWAAFFDRWCAEHGWKPPEWRRSDDVWLGTTVQPGAESPGRAIRFWFAPDGRGEQHGLVLIAPEASR